MLGLKLLSISSNRLKSYRKTIKDNSGQGLKVVDAESGQEHPLKYGITDFSDETFLRDFIRINNRFVEWVREFDVDAEDQYNEFYTLGLRVSQQLEGEFRRRTHKRFVETRDCLEDLIIDEAITWRENHILSQYDVLIEESQNVSEEDREQITSLVAALKEMPDNVLDRFRQRISAESRPKLGPVEAWELKEYDKSDLVESYKEVPDKLKLPFLEIANYGYFNEVVHPLQNNSFLQLAQNVGEVPVINPAGNFLPDIVEIIRGLDVDSAQAYLSYARHVLENEPYNEFFSSAIKDIQYVTEGFTSEQSSKFYSILEMTLKEGFSYTHVWIASDAVKMEEYCTEEEIMGILNSTFEKLKKTDETNANHHFQNLSREKNPNYL